MVQVLSITTGVCTGWSTFFINVLLGLKYIGILCLLKFLLSFPDTSDNIWNDKVVLFVVSFLSAAKELLLDLFVVLIKTQFLSASLM